MPIGSGFLHFRDGRNLLGNAGFNPHLPVVAVGLVVRN